MTHFRRTSLSLSALSAMWILALGTPLIAQGEPASPEEAASQYEMAPRKVDAQRVAELTALILAKPFEQKNYRLRAIEYAKGEAWGEAATDYRKIVELNPAQSQLWQQAATLVVLAEDADAYKQICDKMLERFGRSDNQGDLERTPKVCCLAPQVIGELDQHIKMAEAAVKAVEASERTYWAPYHHRSQALVYYRRKEYAQALEALRKSDRLNLEFDEHRFGDIEVSNRALEAMCLIRRGNLEGGAKMLEKAKPILEAKMADVDEFYEDEFWHDWLIAKVLHDEAQKLVEAGGMGDVKWGGEKQLNFD